MRPSLPLICKAATVAVICIMASGCAFMERSLNESQRQQARQEYKDGTIDRAAYEENMRRADESERRSAEDQSKTISPEDIRQAQDEAH